MQSPIVFFDGICGLCNRLVDLGIRFAKNADLKWAPLQGKTAGKLLPHALRARPRSLAFYHRGQFLIEDRAAFAVLRELKMPWRALGLLRFLPSSWTSFLYRLIARHRYRLWGVRQQCRRPSVSEQKFFLD